MIKERFFLVTIIVGLIIGIIWIINFYENRLHQKQFAIIDGIKTAYTAQEVRTMIKALPNYQKDSIVVFDNGTIKSLLPELDGGLAHAQNDPHTKKYLEGIARSENLPFGFVVYRHVVHYYIEEQKAKIKK